jgi:CrcB protein
MTGAVVWLGIGAAGAAGTAARFLIHETVGHRAGRSLGAQATLIVNVSGTLVLGILVGAALDGDAYRMAATGFLGAYTTFSTWMLESHRLAADRNAAGAWANIVVSLLLGIAAAVLGRHLGATFS